MAHAESSLDSGLPIGPRILTPDVIRVQRMLRLLTHSDIGAFTRLSNTIDIEQTIALGWTFLVVFATLISDTTVQIHAGLVVTELQDIIILIHRRSGTGPGK